MVIQAKYLPHTGGAYVYRVSHTKTLELCKKYPSLRSYLEKMFLTCPDKYFSNGGPRSSLLRFKLLGTSPKEATTHEVSLLSKHGLSINFDRIKDNHSRVQLFMLEHDKKTIAIEVPLWLHHNELGHYNTLFNTEEELTGHIDILRIENSKIWVWDYKPNPQKEVYATTQVYFYALMLSKRTGIPLTEFRCGYFNDNLAYTFLPEMMKIQNN